MLSEILRMLSPCLNRCSVALHAARHEDLVPQRVHRFGFGKRREHLLCPLGTRKRADAPRKHVLILIAAILQKLLSGRLMRAQDAIAVDAQQVFGIVRNQMQERCAFFGVHRHHIGAVLRELVEHRIVRMEVFCTGHVIVVPHHHDFAAAVFVRDVRAHTRKRCMIDRREQQQRLSLLDVDADLDEQFGILSELVFHNRFLSVIHLPPPSRRR